MTGIGRTIWRLGVERTHSTLRPESGQDRSHNSIW